MSSTTAGQVIRCKGTTFSFFLTFFVVDLVVVSLFQSCDCSMGFFPFLCCLYHLLWWSQLFVPCWLSLFLCFKGLCLIAKSWAVSSFRMRHDLLSFPKTRIVWNRIYYLCTKNNNQYSNMFCFWLSHTNWTPVCLT